MSRRPCNPFPPSDTYTTVRASHDTVERINEIREILAEWMLSSADPDHRRQALSLSMDHTLRIIVATFARDYGLSLSERNAS